MGRKGTTDVTLNLSQVRLGLVCRLLVALSVTMVLFGLVASSAAAAEGSRRPIRESGTNEYFNAFSSECTQEQARTVCTDTSVYAETFTNRQGVESTFVCVDTNTYSISPSGRYSSLGSESGCTEVAGDAVTVAGNLSSATLAPTDVELSSCNRRTCTVSRTVTVSGTLTGVGTVNSSSGRGTDKFDGCIIRYSYTSANRQGEGTITIDGTSMDATGGFGSTTYKVTYRNCTFGE